MRVSRRLPLSAIRMDRIPHKRVLDLVDFLRNGGEVPPIRVAKVAGGFEIRDGRHRWAAYRLLGRESIDVTYGL